MMSLQTHFIEGYVYMFFINYIKINNFLSEAVRENRLTFLINIEMKLELK